MSAVFDNVKVDRTLWDRLRAKVKKLDRMYVKVGILASKGGEQTHPDSEMSLIEIMATHEFGSSDDRIPERRPLRKTFVDGDGPRRLGEVQAKLAKQIITGNMEPEKALKILGTWAVKEVKNTTRCFIGQRLSKVELDELMNTLNFNVTVKGAS